MYIILYLQESKEILLKTDSTYNIIYPLLFETESLDIAIILEFDWLSHDGILAHTPSFQIWSVYASVQD